MIQSEDVARATHVRNESAPPALLYEMIRSFVTLARTLNLSHAVKELGSTRQTVRRHISLLEKSMGVQLFVVDDRRYQLTREAQEALPEAIDILARGKIWIHGNTRHVDGMLRLSHEEPNGWTFYQQQQPLTEVWDGPSDLLRSALAAWSNSHGLLESEKFRRLRPYVLVYRDSPSGWICVEVGEESFYAKWWGWKNARSSIGRPLGQFPGGPEFATMLEYPFKEVQSTYGARLDEVVTQIPRDEGGVPEPLAYQRLLMGARFPDNSFALIAAVDRSKQIKIAGLQQTALSQMPQDAFVAFP